MTKKMTVEVEHKLAKKNSCKVTVKISKVTVFFSFWQNKKHRAVTNCDGESSMFLDSPKSKKKY